MLFVEMDADKDMKTSIFFIFIFLFFSSANKDYCLAGGELISIFVLSETEDESIISIKYKGKINFKKELYDNKVVLIFKDCILKTEISSYTTGRRSVKEIRKSYHHEDNSLWIIVDFYRKLNYDIKISEKEIKIIASKNSQKQSDNLTNKKADFIKISPIPEKIRMRMEIYSWGRRCPVPIDDLSYIILSYWGFDDKEHKGELVVNKKVADEVVTIFKELYEKKFPIERMRLIDEYKGNDDISMADNNTSAFNCRKSTGNDKVFSKHSYGLAIDINPLVNPYIKEDIVLPPNGNKYRDRKQVIKGMIVKGDNCYNAFIKRGWKWGGEWNSLKDYQHFEKNIVK